MRLARRPGQKEARYAHLLGGPVENDQDDTAPVRVAPDSERVGALEAKLDELLSEVADLRSQLQSFRKQFE
jgi:uncharacterized protein YceH (UPF0502 family)